MADVFRKLPLLLLVVLLLFLLVVFHVCILGNVPRRRSKRRSSMKDTRTEARQAIPRSGGEQVGGRRSGESLWTVWRASQWVGYEALPPHLPSLPGSSDEEEEGRRPRTLSTKERASKGFNFTMDRAVYDEIERSTEMNHTINPKNVADTGASGGVRLPSTSNADPESVADVDRGEGREDDNEGLTRGSSQTGYPRWFWEEEEHEAADFRRAYGMHEKHGVLMASTMESASKRQCSIQVMEVAAPAKKGCHQAKKQRKVVQGGPAGNARDVHEEVVVEEEMMNKDDDFEEEEEQPLKGERDTFRTARRWGCRGEIGGRVKEGAAAHESVQCVQTPSKCLNTPPVDVAGSSQVAVQGETLRSPAVVSRRDAVTAAGEAGEVPKAGDGGVVGEDDEALVHRLRRPHAASHAMYLATKLWEDNTRFWNETQGSAIVKIIQETREYLVLVARGVQPPAIRWSISLPHNTIPHHKIEDESKFNAAKERAFKVQTISLRAIHGCVFKSESRQRGYQLAYQYALNHSATDIARAMWSAEDWSTLVSLMLFRTTLDVDMKLPLWFVGANIVDRHEDDECAAYQEACVQRLVRDFTSAVGTAEAMDDGLVSYERLKAMVEAMRYLLAATMWIMRMVGDDPKSHYDAWVFMQLSAKTMLLASMNRQFDVRRHIIQATQVMTDKLGRPPPTLPPPPLCTSLIGCQSAESLSCTTRRWPPRWRRKGWIGWGQTPPRTRMRSTTVMAKSRGGDVHDIARGKGMTPNADWLLQTGDYRRRPPGCCRQHVRSSPKRTAEW
ncbi:hypothetical protein CBR_g21287 [Chara braunii]|uniref:Uncharacterized protein n=1 Tax=Chara braunii TaxID=69332 RepID=A0A388L173_CHABU|nr:hypothetical protein CBR_g21287 [Chara braunii]|eukprot:GBG76047.1 hypothetical protein CBR_g21287 [Chara braunii]